MSLAGRVTISAQMKKRTQIFSSNPVTNPYSSPVALPELRGWGDKVSEVQPRASW